MPSTADLRSLRPHLVFALLAALSGLALVAIAVQFHGQAREQLQVAKADGAELTQQIARFATEEAELREAMHRYSDWVKRGIIGTEQRMKWIEALQEMRRRRRLLALHYEFAPQQALSLAQPTPVDLPFHFVTSPMQLTFTAVHEGDVIGLLEDLREDIPAYVRPRRCLLKRKPSAPPGTTDLLEMDCQMDWITINRQP